MWISSTSAVVAGVTAAASVVGTEDGAILAVVEAADVAAAVGVVTTADVAAVVVV